MQYLYFIVAFCHTTRGIKKKDKVLQAEKRYEKTSL